MRGAKLKNHRDNLTLSLTLKDKLTYYYYYYYYYYYCPIQI